MDNTVYPVHATIGIVINLIGRTASFEGDVFRTSDVSLQLDPEYLLNRMNICEWTGFYLSIEMFYYYSMTLLFMKVLVEFECIEFDTCLTKQINSVE